jgi:hypothetical protein
MTADDTLEATLTRTTRALAMELKTTLRRLLEAKTSATGFTRADIARMARITPSALSRWTDEGAEVDPCFEDLVRALLTVCSLGSRDDEGRPHVQISSVARDVVEEISRDLSAQLVGGVLEVASAHTDRRVMELAGFDAARSRSLSRMRRSMRRAGQGNVTRPRTLTALRLGLGALWCHALAVSPR